MEKMRLNGTHNMIREVRAVIMIRQINPNVPYLNMWIQFVVSQNSDFDLLSNTSPERELELESCILLISSVRTFVSSMTLESIILINSIYIVNKWNDGAEYNCRHSEGSLRICLLILI